jgi:hypothetical protein
MIINVDKLINYKHVNEPGDPIDVWRSDAQRKRNPLVRGLGYRMEVGSQHNFLTENSFALRCLLTETSRTSPIVHSRWVRLSKR